MRRQVLGNRRALRQVLEDNAVRGGAGRDRELERAVTMRNRKALELLQARIAAR